jgi:hypothetical protein
MWSAQLRSSIKLLRNTGRDFSSCSHQYSTGNDVDIACFLRARWACWRGLSLSFMPGLYLQVSSLGILYWSVSHCDFSHYGWSKILSAAANVTCSNYFHAGQAVAAAGSKGPQERWLAAAGSATRYRH